MTLHWSIDDERLEAPRLVLWGDITEASDFSFVDGLRADERPLVIDLQGVEQINSCGVREWIDFVSKLDGRQVHYELDRCSPAVVRQLNMVANFRGAGEVRSFMAPYYCEACGTEQHHHVGVRADHPEPEVASTVTCCKCGREAEFDDLMPTYVAFLEAA